MKLPVVDASFLFDLERGLPGALRVFDAFPEEEWIVPYQSAAEYLVGVEDPIPSLRILGRSYRLVHSSDEILLEAARLFNVASAKGRRLAWSDLHIAAVASVHHMQVVTGDERAFPAAGIGTYLYRKQGDRQQT